MEATEVKNLKSIQILDDCQRSLDLLEQVPDVLRSGQIGHWTEDAKNRLNPENGLCLSATYGAAFYRHHISFDEHKHLIVSKAIKDHFTDVAAKSYFLDREGQSISLLTKFLPSQALLEKQRKQVGWMIGEL